VWVCDVVNSSISNDDHSTELGHFFQVVLDSFDAGDVLAEVHQVIRDLLLAHYGDDLDLSQNGN
jgi:hypothetical protein